MVISFGHLLNAMRSLERGVIVLIFLVMAILFSFSVLIRVMPGNFASSFAWIEEAVGMMNIYLVFLTLGLALEKGRHVSISTVRDSINDNIRKKIYKTIDLIGLLFCFYLGVLSVQLTSFVHSTGQLSPTLGVSMSLIYVAPIIGFSLMGLRYFLSLIGVLDRCVSDPEDAEFEGEEVNEIQSVKINNKKNKKRSKVS